MRLYIGLMSGTSMDGIDAVLLEIEATAMQLRAAVAHHWPESLQARLRHAAEDSERIGLSEFGQLDTMVALEFAQAAETLLTAARVPASAVRAVGSHGQTILHRPHAQFLSPCRSAIPTSLPSGSASTWWPISAAGTSPRAAKARP